jgi:hypothetical protein
MQVEARAPEEDLEGETTGAKGPRAQYRWNLDALGNPSDVRMTKLINRYTTDRYGEGPQPKNVKELPTSKKDRERSLEEYMASDDVFSTLVDGVLVKSKVAGTAAYQKAQTEIRIFKEQYLSQGSNRSGFNGELTAVQKACLVCVKLDVAVSQGAAEKRELAEAENKLLESLERGSLGLLGPEGDAAAFKEGKRRYSCPNLISTLSMLDCRGKSCCQALAPSTRLRGL